MRWHVVERLSPRQALTPDGYLIVTDTIIARCGDQIYHHNEVPLDPDDDGIITVSRDAAEVFRPEAIASFEGKPITDDHPFEEVTPSNHRDLAVGHVQNVRRGTGDDDDCLVADLVFTDPHVIDKVRGRRKLALSCGYDAHYEGVGRGRGRQVRISGNHVALVDEGRCGARCTIGDSGEAVFSYLAAKKVHDKGCGCDACDIRPRLLVKRRRLNLWIDGVLAWRRTWTDFDPNEPRDPTGEWTTGGGGAGKSNQQPLSSPGKEPSHGNADPAPDDPARVSGASAPASPSHFTRRTAGGTGGGGLRPDGSGVRSVFESDDKNSPAPVWHELAAQSGEAFAKDITESKAGSPYGAAVAVYPTDEYNQMRLFSTPDTKAGFALHGDDIISVYRKPDGPKNVVGPILDLATQNGGRRLDCFDTVLPSLYAQHGFKAVARLPFNDEYKPEGWDYATYGKYNKGRPDVVFMAYDPSYGKPYQPGDGKVVSDYDEGTALQHAAISGKPTQDDFDPNEKRDDDGKWTTGGGGGSSGGAAKKASDPVHTPGDPAKSGAFVPGKSGKSVSFNKDKPPKAEDGGKTPFASWANAPKTNQGWEDLAKDTSSGFAAPPLAHPDGKQGAGVIIREPDGRVWIVHPSKQFGGYKATFPKGTQEPGMSLRATALKETYEESGLHVKLTGFAGDKKRSTGNARYYYAERIGGSPADHGWETEAVTLADPADLKDFLNNSTDRSLVDQYVTKDAADISKWKKTGGNLGSNAGGQYTDENGKLHYVKLQKSDDHARNELLAARLFEAAGSPVLDTRLVDLGNGKLGTETEWKDKTNINLNDPAHLKMAHEDFATNAWLANWDAVGMGQHENDWNQAIIDGKMTTVDPGGSMIFRAQGGPKGAAWGDSVGEWDSMRHGTNPTANKAYGGMTSKELRASVLKVAAVPDSEIDDLVEAHGPGNDTQRKELAARLKARKRDLVKRAMQTQDARRLAA